MERGHERGPEREPERDNGKGRLVRASEKKREGERKGMIERKRKRESDRGRGHM